MDGNIGIGGDVYALLRRCRSLVAAGGLILCEVDPDPDRHERFDVTLRSGGIASRPMPWVRIGGRALRDTAATVDLLVEEEWRAISAASSHSGWWHDAGSPAVSDADAR